MKNINNILKAGITFVCLVLLIAAIGFFALPEKIDEVSTPLISERTLIPGGNSVGVKMDVKGVLIVGLEEIKNEKKQFVNPGLEAGLEIGDTILEINGIKVYRAQEVINTVNEIRGDLKLKVKRKDRTINLKLTPVKSAYDGTYKLGVWVKDKTAGIGTLTFYNPETGKFGALGHGITDVETGEILSVAEGELVNSRVESIKEGKAGNPGEIRGIFYEAEAPIGYLEKNTEYGIFGSAYEDIQNSVYTKPLVVATRDQVRKGPAEILTTINGNKVEKFEIQIEKVNYQETADTRSLVIRVTDERLLKETGGIVQGMSGSPIIQNGRLVGAVTHVFINNPGKGYGIFIDWMLQEGDTE
ncbi:MAG: SpoIVB peptidase [Eubacteriales bacterium]|nr:SpoIVB peptidase [Eubacteriales bacterium]